MCYGIKVYNSHCLLSSIFSHSNFQTFSWYPIQKNYKQNIIWKDRCMNHNSITLSINLHTTFPKKLVLSTPPPLKPTLVLIVPLIRYRCRNVYPWEVVDVCCFMLSSETALVAFPISCNVFLVLQSKLFNRFFDDFIPSITSHGLCAEFTISQRREDMTITCINRFLNNFKGYIFKSYYIKEKIIMNPY